MNWKFLFLIVSVFLFINFTISDDRPKRFSKPHEQEAEEKVNSQKSFTDYIPQYYSSVFLNYNISRDSFPQNETSVKISRKDPNRVVAAWRDFRRGVNPANRKVGYSYSTDAGETWSVSRLLDSTLLPGGLIRNSDPAVAVDSAGNFYIAVIALTNTNGNGTIGVYKSTDGGVTFPTAVIASQTGSEDKEYIASDLTPGSPYYNNLYMSWTSFSSNIVNLLTKSTDGGISWTAGIEINDVNNVGQGSDLAIGLNGDVYVTWLTGDFNNDIIMFDKSVDGGESMGTDVVVGQGTTPNIPITSSGVTFPSIATDISGSSYRGNIYVTWCDARNGDPDIFISRSTNRGVNWSAPLRVNDDAVSNGKLQCWPWIEVNDSGKISIVYYDSRNTSSNTIIDAYLALSTDGGVSFTNYRLSTQSFPTNAPNTAVRFGDYIGIDYYKDRIVPVWTDERAGGTNSEAYTAIVSTPVNVNTIVNSIPDKFRLGQNYPNPFNPETKISYSLPSAQFITLKIFDIMGREVESLVNQKQSAGNYEVTFTGNNISSGIYFYRLQTENYSDTKRMILLK